MREITLDHWWDGDDDDETLRKWERTHQWMDEWIDKRIREGEKYDRILRSSSPCLEDNEQKRNPPWWMPKYQGESGILERKDQYGVFVYSNFVDLSPYSWQASSLVDQVSLWGGTIEDDDVKSFSWRISTIRWHEFPLKKLLNHLCYQCYHTVKNIKFEDTYPCITNCLLFLVGNYSFTLLSRAGGTQFIQITQ